MDSLPNYLQPEVMASRRAPLAEISAISFVVTIFPATLTSEVPTINLSGQQTPAVDPRTAQGEPKIFSVVRTRQMFPYRVSVSVYDRLGSRTLFHVFSRSSRGIIYDSSGWKNSISGFADVAPKHLALFVGGGRQSMESVQDTNITVNCISMRTVGVSV